MLDGRISNACPTILGTAPTSVQYRVIKSQNVMLAAPPPPDAPLRRFNLEPCVGEGTRPLGHSAGSQITLRSPMRGCKRTIWRTRSEIVCRVSNTSKIVSLRRRARAVAVLAAGAGLGAGRAARIRSRSRCSVVGSAPVMGESISTPERSRPCR